MVGNIKKRRTFLRELGAAGLVLGGVSATGCETIGTGNGSPVTTGTRIERVPPGQSVIDDFRVLHVGSIPDFDPDTWSFKVEGLVENELTFNYEEFLALPGTTTVSDFHCVTGWTKFDIQWKGVLFKDIYELTEPLDGAQYVTMIAECTPGCPEQDYTTNLPVEVLLDDDVLLAYEFDGVPLTPEHGFPLRMVVPSRYAYKSAKWVRKLRFMAEDERGFWELRGYNNNADPWKEERYS